MLANESNLLFRIRLAINPVWQRYGAILRSIEVHHTLHLTFILILFNKADNYLANRRLTIIKNDNVLTILPLNIKTNFIIISNRERLRL